MADIYLHSRLSEDVMKELDIDVDQNLVFLGAQGPDPMYYNVFHKNHKTFRYYANSMHRNDTRDIFKHMISYVEKNQQKDTISFLIGYICHYALDVKIHPYVYHNVGIVKEDDPDTYQYKGLHLKFERSIDALMIQKELGIPSRKLKLSKKYMPIKHSPDSVNKIMGYVIKKMYDDENGANIYKEAVAKMYKNINVMVYDPFGIKKQIFKLADFIRHSHDMFLSDVSYFNHLEKYDYHNSQKKAWYHPVTNEEYHYSVMDLYDQARLFALDMIPKTMKYIAGNKSINLNSVFENLSFNSGLDCNQDKPFQYYNIYRKK